MRLLDCNDASLRLWNDGDALWSPGVVWLSGDRYQFGEPAWAQARRAPREISNRYWHRLSTQPLSPALGPRDTPPTSYTPILKRCLMA